MRLSSPLLGSYIFSISSSHILSFYATKICYEGAC
nr:MAG TPA: hypothetical protein [Caudoviricetes sp.]